MRIAPTTLQQRSWLTALGRRGGARTTPHLLKVDGDFSPESFAIAARRLVERHDALRMCFNQPDAKTCAVLDPDECPVEVEMGEPGKAGDVDSLREFLLRPFPLSEPGRIRARIFRDENDGGHVIAVTSDHLVMDGLSLGLAVKDMVRLYVAGDAAAVPSTEGRQYSHFAHAQEESMLGEWGARRRDFWLRYLDEWGDVHPATPVARSHTEASGTAVHKHIDLGDEVRAGFAAAATKQRETSFTTLVAAILSSQLRWGVAQSGVITNFHGRVLPMARATIGLFAHGVCLHLSSKEAPDFGTAMRAVADRTTAVRTYGIPLNSLADQRPDMLPKKRQPFIIVGKYPRTTGFFTAPTGGPRLNELPLGEAGNIIKLGLSIVLYEEGPDAWLRVRYDTADFATESVDTLLEGALTEIRSYANGA